MARLVEIASFDCPKKAKSVTFFRKLREECTNAEFFLVRIFRIRSEYGEISSTHYLSVFSSNAGKYGPKKTPYMKTFHAVLSFCFEKQNLSLLYKVSSKKRKMRFQVNLFRENRYFWTKIYYFRTPPSRKNFKKRKSIKVSNVHKLAFLKKLCSDFF